MMQQIRRRVCSASAQETFFVASFPAGSPRDAGSKSEASNIPVCHALQPNQAVPGGDVPGVTASL